MIGLRSMNLFRDIVIVGEGTECLAIRMMRVDSLKEIKHLCLAEIFKL
jgi:hypothetical protein